MSDTGVVGKIGNSTTYQQGFGSKIQNQRIDLQQIANMVKKQKPQIIEKLQPIQPVVMRGSRHQIEKLSPTYLASTQTLNPVTNTANTVSPARAPLTKQNLEISTFSANIASKNRKMQNQRGK